MAYEIRSETGSLFKNDKRTTEDHPNARGSALVNGVHYWVSAWTKRTQSGDPWQSLAFTRKEEQPQASNVQRIADNITPPADLDDDLDSVPF
jgi:hypothetical protein